MFRMRKNVYIYIHAYVYRHIYIYIYMCVYTYCVRIYPLPPPENSGVGLVLALIQNFCQMSTAPVCQRQDQATVNNPARAVLGSHIRRKIVRGRTTANLHWHTCRALILIQMREQPRYYWWEHKFRGMMPKWQGQPKNCKSRETNIAERRA